MKKYLTRNDILQILPVSKPTWERWKSLGKTPPHIKIGGRCFWDREVFMDWLAAQPQQGNPPCPPGTASA